MNVNLKITDIFRPCRACDRVNSCPYSEGYAEDFDEDTALKERLYNLFRFGTDCFRSSYDEDDYE